MDLGSLLDLNTVLVAIVVILLICLVSRSLQWPANIPPGPPGYPLLGNLLLLRQGNILDTFRNLRKQHGDVFSVKVGPSLTVVFNGIDILKEAFIKRADEFSGRPYRYISEKVFEGKGIGSSSGEHWKLTRKFSSKTLREFGFGGRSLESRVKEETASYLDSIEQHNGCPFDIKPLTVLAVSNVTCSIAFGNRFEYTDARFKRLTSLFADNFRLTVESGAVRNLPGARYLPGDMFNIKKLISNYNDIKECIDEQINEHRTKFDEDNQRDFIDAFLTEQNKRGKDEQIFEDINLSAIIINLFLGGTVTLSGIFVWAILYLLHNKNIQDKLRKEIESVVGTSRLPSLADKPALPYNEAFMTEVHRMANFAPFSVPHGATKDIQFRGMTIPSGSMILVSLDSVMNDPNIFENPDTFNPDRYLGQDGQLNGKERNVISFSLGPRTCLGESLARLKLFTLMTSLLQRFEILPEVPDQLPSLESIPGLTRAPKDFKCRIVKI
ncbi:cytochrome P450 2B2-like [Mizuhopecten yessoensis]|uniref:Cytochrome P450 2B19 n=1 Tax=Mizuhopecten yessoensis TaxID=6573 RepID=A0A210QE55_MIZYE|nr:cytochrome P450 2B2-like [Mizuhopecten yessoensis]OWF47047.1 Cytochrome P450 2B19 [Mizuhopecten yessoensis]